MKKIMALLTVMFMVTLSVFSQKPINGSIVGLLVNGTNSNAFDVAINPTNPDQRLFAGELLITFNVPMNDINIQLGVMMDNPSATYFYFGDTQLEGVYKVKVTYDAFDENVTMGINSTGEYSMPEFTANDTLSSYNNGVSSVNTDSIWNSGVSSVNTDSIYNVGKASVDTMEIWNGGYDFGVVEGDNKVAEAEENAYDAGYTDGENGASTGTYDDIAVTNVNVYPNPASDLVNVECDNFNNVQVITITGQVVDTFYTNQFSVSNLNSGVYVLRIEDDNFNITNTRLSVQ